jgi:hypothetical protein
VRGSDKQLGTFTANTTPSDAQAQSVIDDAVTWVLGQVGELPVVPPASEQIQWAARSAAEWRAAADIEIAYPNRDADIRLYMQLDQRAKDSITTLRQALAVEVGGGAVDLLPIWTSPAPAPWGDKSPGSGADYLPTFPITGPPTTFQ